MTPTAGPAATAPATATTTTRGPSTTPSTDLLGGKNRSVAQTLAKAAEDIRNDRADAPRTEYGVLFTRESPVLAVETLGPRRIIVGQESTYEVNIRNSGQVAADQVVVNVRLPEWAEVLGAEASTGSTSSSKTSGAKEFQWKVGLLEAGGQQKLKLRIVPRQSKPIDLAVTWDWTPVASETVIEVQEPKLEMNLEGPREVLYGERQTYRLELSNSGTGDAQDVKLSLTPIGGEKSPAAQAIGVIPAGGKKVIELELTARQTSALTIELEATAAGGLRAHLAEKIAVQRAALAVEVETPKAQFMGTQATYRVRVRNTGTAPAKNLEVKASLPAGLDHVASAPACRLGASGRDVVWSVASLAPAAASAFELTCDLTKAGTVRLDVNSKADGDLIASATADINVEALADLRLSVADPQGPIPVGTEALYEVDIQNRGTKGAEDVEVMVYFSEGVEPVSAEGSRHQIGPGQISFDKIPSLAAGEKITLKIKAKAQATGNHVCRVEVHCEALGARLVSEEMTHYYAASETPSRAQARAAGSPAASLVGDRYAKQPHAMGFSPNSAPAAAKTSSLR